MPDELIEPAAPDVIVKQKIDKFWSEEDKQTARALWNEGQSGTMIGKALGRSRSAVMGLIYRFGLARRLRKGPATLAPVRRRAAQRYGKKKRAPWYGVAELTPEITPTAVSIVDLESAHCRWPIRGEPGPDMLYCGGGAFADLPYCARHCRMAYQSR